jgi:arginase
MNFMASFFSPAHCIALIGAPTDVGAGMRGACLGPQALRVAGLPEALVRRGLTVVDRSDLAGPQHPGAVPPVNGYRHLAQVSSWNTLVHGAVLAALCNEQLPMVLGGDHSVAIGSISAVAQHCRAAKRDLRVLWLDAHADFNTHVRTRSYNLHGMPVACLCGEGPQELISLGGPGPRLAVDQMRQIGVRSVDNDERDALHQAGMTVYDMRTIDELGMRVVMAQALEGMTDATHLHVSFDVDFLDPQLAPGVSTPVPGGPTYREAQLCMEMIADSGRLASLDIVELNPARDVHNRSAELTVDLVESLFGKSTLIRPRP